MKFGNMEDFQRIMKMAQEKGAVGIGFSGGNVPVNEDVPEVFEKIDKVIADGVDGRVLVNAGLVSEEDYDDYFEFLNDNEVDSLEEYYDKNTVDNPEEFIQSVISGVLGESSLPGFGVGIQISDEDMKKFMNNSGGTNTDNAEDDEDTDSEESPVDVQSVRDFVNSLVGNRTQSGTDEESQDTDYSGGVESYFNTETDDESEDFEVDVKLRVGNGRVNIDIDSDDFFSLISEKCGYDCDCFNE